MLEYLLPDRPSDQPAPAMKQHIRHHRLPQLVLYSVWVLPSLLSQSTAFADIIRTIKDEDIPCRVTESPDGGLLITYGDAAGRQERRLAPSEVKQRWQAADEFARIEAAKDVPRLAQWTASYYRAGYETLAKRCMRRAMSLDKTFSDLPLSNKADPAFFGGTKPAKDFARFWNLVMLDEKASRVTTADIPALLKLASWAHRAGLKQEAAYYLRKAWSEDRSSPETAGLAAKWDIKLEGWLSIDLTAALDSSLFAESIRDEGLQVPADAGRIFFNLPVRYDPELGGEPRRESQNLNRNTLKGKDAKEFYGLRPLVVREGRVRIDGHEGQSIIERMILQPGEGARRMAELRNQLGPRNIEVRSNDEKQRAPKASRQPRLRNNPTHERATGWVAYIFELPSASTEFKVLWADGGEETLDLNFIRGVSLISPDEIRNTVAKQRNGSEPPGWPWSVAPAVVSSLNLIQSSSPAMAALAIERLRRIRTELGWRMGPEVDKDMVSWSLAVDEAVLRSAIRNEEQVRLAAFRYFCEYPPQYESPVSEHAISVLSKAEPDLQFAWVRMLDCGLRLDPCTYWWRLGTAARQKTEPVEDGSGNRGGEGMGFPPSGPRSAPEMADRPTPSQRRAARLLEAILQSDDPIVSSEALDILLSLPNSATDWKFMRFASAPAQGYALARIHDIRDELSVSRLIQALMLSARPEIAQDVAREARVLGLRAKDAESAILTQWTDLDSDERRAAFLKVLSGVALGEMVYSSRFLKVLDDSLVADQSVREAAWRFFIAQLRLRRENCTTEFLIGDTSDSTTRGPFPLMIDPASRDPLLKGVIDAARHAPSGIRLDALRSLLELGYADEAARCLIESSQNGDAGVRSGDSPAAIHSLDPLSLTDVVELSRSDALLAFLGQFLRSGSEALAPEIIAHLNAIAADTPPAEHWRIRAALKSGVNIEELDSLGQSLDPPASIGLNRWLSKLCHMTDQDRQRLSTGSSREERAERLAQINLRRGRLVEGYYGGLVVLAVTSRADRAPDVSTGQPILWNLSRRVTVPLPSIELRASDKVDGLVEVFCQGCPVGKAIAITASGPADSASIGDSGAIGSGRVMEQVLPIRGPRAYFPVLTSSPAWWIVAGFVPTETGESPPSAEDVFGPLRLPNHKVLKVPTPGTITLDAAPVVREAIRQAGLFKNEELNELVPSPFAVTLRYRLFGLYSGCGTDVLPGFYPPDDKNVSRVKDYDGQWHILNMMLVLEKMD